MMCTCKTPRQWVPNQLQLDTEEYTNKYPYRDTHGPILKPAPIESGFRPDVVKLWFYPPDWNYRVDLGFHKCEES